jgi:uncharacterized protein
MIQRKSQRCPSLYKFRSIAFILLLALFVAPAHSQADQHYEPTALYRIQGDGLASPLAERWLDAVGVVTGLTANGFYLQDPIGDGNPATSDGLFVYTHQPPTVLPGECVLVQRALVSEFYEKTELSRMKAVLPDHRCPTTTITPVRIPLPYYGAAPVELYEQYEGMLVEFPSLTGVVQGPTKRLNDGRLELAIIPAPLQPYLPGGRVFQEHGEASGALIHLSSALGAQLPDAQWGDRIQIGSPVGDTLTRAVLDYNFGKYQLLLLPDEPLTHEPKLLTDPPGGAAAGDEFTLCSMNLYGLGRGSAQITDEVSYKAHLRKRALSISEQLQGCTIIGLQEAGTPADAEALAAELREVFKLPYESTALPGPQTDNVEFPLTNALLTRTDRVRVLKASAPQACTEHDYSVSAALGTCPAERFALFDRTPLVVDVAVTGDWESPYRLRLIVNHWKSKAGDESFNVVRRTRQALFVAALVQATLMADPAANVAVLGDLNDYYQSGPVEALRTNVQPPLVHPYDYLPPLDRYTYIFNGASQVLDHLLLTPGMARALAEVDILHANVDYPYPPFVDFTNTHHASDHDLIQLRIRPAGAALLGGNLRHPSLQVELVDEAGQPLGVTLTDERGDFRFWNLRPGVVTLRVVAPQFVSLSVPEMTLTVETGYNEAPTTVVKHQSAALAGAIIRLGPEITRLAVAEQ